MKKLVLFFLASILIYHGYCQLNVGLGVIDPTKARFELNGAAGKTTAIFGGNFQGISLQRGNPAIGFNQYNDGITRRYIAGGFAGEQSYDPATGIMYFESSPSGLINNPIGTPVRSITVSNTGAVGIGMAPAAGYKLSIARGSGSDGTAVFRGSAYASHINFSTGENTYIRGGKDNGMVYINESGGGTVYMGSASNMVKVGINSGNPFYAMELRQVNGKGLILVSNEFDNWHINVGPNTAQGSYQRLYFNEAANPIGSYHPITGQYLGLSDRRAKEKIHAMSRVSNKIMQLQPVSYQMKDDANHANDIGFIAQDVKKIFPEIVLTPSADKETAGVKEIYGLNYSGFAVYAIKTIQEQQAIIDELKTKIKSVRLKMNKAGLKN